MIDTEQFTRIPMFIEILVPQVLNSVGRQSVSNAVTLNGRGHQMKNICKRLWQEEEGQDLVEYGLLVVLVALAAIGAMSSLASGVSDAFSKAAANLTTAT
jgi:pilus assembly protein Flp/PilA